jgi:hypothetical protein
MARDDERVEQEHEPDRSRCPVCGELEVGRRRPGGAGGSGLYDPDQPALVAFCARGHEWWPGGTAHVD